MLPSKARVAAAVLRVLPRKRLSRQLGRLAELSVPAPVLDRFVGAYKSVRHRPPRLRAPEPATELRRVLHAPPARRQATARRGPRRALARRWRPRSRHDRAWRGAAREGPRYDVGERSAIGRARHASMAVSSPSCISPRDYHRMHAPASGRVSSTRYIAGRSISERDRAAACAEPLRGEQARGVHQETDRFGGIVSVMVGAIVVDRIGIAFDAGS